MGRDRVCSKVLIIETMSNIDVNVTIGLEHCTGQIDLITIEIALQYGGKGQRMVYYIPSSTAFP